MGTIAATTYIHNRPDFKLGEFFILLFAFSALALAGSLYHDFLWCGTRTNWYTELAEGGYDFDLWIQIVNVESRDYRLLGASQGTMSLFLIIFAGILLWKFNSFLEVKLNRTQKIQLIILSFFGVIFFGFFLFIIDYGSLFDLNVTFHSLYLGILLMCLLYYQIGKVLALNSNLKESSQE